MRVDPQTLRDLGIFPSHESKRCVFDWANRTRTQGGAHRLKERFRAPLSDPAELRRTQDAVRFLTGRPALLDPLLRGSAWLGAERYAHSSFAALNHPIERLPGASFRQFGARVEDGVPSFDHRVRPGVSEQRLGMLILERERVLALLEGLLAP